MVCSYFLIFPPVLLMGSHALCPSSHYYTNLRHYLLTFSLMWKPAVLLPLVHLSSLRFAVRVGECLNTHPHTRLAAYFPAPINLVVVGSHQWFKFFVSIFAYWEYTVTSYGGGCENWVKACKHGVEWHVVYSKCLSSHCFIISLESLVRH